MSPTMLTRRQLMKLGAITVLGAIPTVKSAAQLLESAPPAGTRRIYRLSLRGRRGSQAAKTHNANHLFATYQAANGHRAHPGDNSEIVTLLIGEGEYQRLFTSRNAVIADMREFRKTAASPAWLRYN